jgi:transposase
MSTKKYRKHSPDTKVAAVRRHLIDHVPISDLCEEYKVKPSLFYKWQKEIFDQALKAYQLSSAPLIGAREKEKIKRLEQKLLEKNEVLAELMQEYVQLKKTLGGI